MDFYEKLPEELLIRFYYEIINNIEKGILTKNMYYEIGIIISVANRSGISLDHPSDFNDVINQQALNDLLQSEQVGTRCSSQIA
ncbi:hypothetical protein SAMN05444673_2983 [Bacillus sp. OV166]|uniref:hypothetical protein n=1 Tax=unclassified Bacillus (in: firmicutes) TaxID=185979 RepID=UPI000A2AE212|nr:MULTISPECIES: hypothetical protein [unclassified Bacillus (in: firmicutes)]PGY06318.1 hypothetical protein COE25_27975 [Bacillus sp. AFS031507]SMQ77641.1 hypothetical protein SAMN05444673_2983 [Bacillus sp. OV166]